MKKSTIEKAVKIAAVVIVAPVVVRVAMVTTKATGLVISKTVDRLKFEKQMRKEMKKGKVVKIKGEYYNVESIDTSPREE